MALSGTTLFAPSIADLVIECYSRLQIRGAALTPEHTIEARRSSNIIFSDWSGSRSGPPLWAVDQITVPLQTGIANYTLPGDTIMLLDVYRRQLTPNTVLTTDTIGVSPSPNGGDLGIVLTAMTDDSGIALLTDNLEPLLSSAGSGVISCTAGSALMTLTWPHHALSVGSPVFFADLISVGGVVLSSFFVVNTVVDANTITFFAPAPAVWTASGSGEPPLLQTVSSSTTVTVTLPNHGLSGGDTYTVPISTPVGGITFSGDYTVVAVSNSAQFTITALTAATSTTAVFSDYGYIRIASQLIASPLTDLVMTSVSRTEYASYPEKLSAGTPTVYWLDRTIIPTVSVWQVPQSGFYYAMIAYRWRQLQDADPVSGQTPDIPNRWIGAFTAELTARLAEKFRPDLFKDKVMLAQAAWTWAEQGDFENVPLYITPGLSGYFR